MFNIHLWNAAGAFLRPKGIHLNANFPHGEEKAVFSCEPVDKAPGKTLYLDPVWIAKFPMPLGLEGPQCKASEMGN